MCRCLSSYNKEGREATAPPKHPLQDAAYGQQQPQAAAWMGAATDQYAMQYGGQQVSLVLGLQGASGGVSGLQTHDKHVVLVLSSRDCLG